jgi:hypothetical protein
VPEGEWAQLSKEVTMGERVGFSVVVVVDLMDAVAMGSCEEREGEGR